ncbi:MAG: hypothetical protein AAF789_13405 [Bacteroidota bacterium]
MDDFSTWWYVIAGIIYLLSRARKKKKGNEPKPSRSRPGTENRPKTAPKSFEELLKEINEGGTGPEEEREPSFEEVTPTKATVKKESDYSSEGRARVFADEESRKVYEDSIKMAEGADLKFERDENFAEKRLFKKPEEEEREYTFADEIRDGLSSNEARKAIIYSEILNRKY